MKFLTTEDATNWCQTHGLRVTGNRYLHYEQSNQLCFTVGLEEKPSSIIGLAGYLAPAWEDVPFEGALLWIRQRGAWGDFSENTGDMMFHQMRLAKGESEPLEKRPAQVFEPEQPFEMYSFLLIPLLFGWDAFLVPENGEYFVFVSHDAVAAVVSRTPEKAEELRARLQSWNPQEDKSWYPRICGR